MLSFLWDLHQQSKLNELGRRASDSAADGRDARRLVEQLEARVDSLTLTTMAMWSLLEEKVGLTEADLARRIEEIDLRDGQRDGRISAALSECPSCGRRMSARHRHCMYCGAEGLRPG